MNKRIENRTGTVVCGLCGEEVDFQITWRGTVGFVLKGVALPFSDAMKVELGRRQVGALCGPCWRKGPKSKIPVAKVVFGEEPKRILTGEET